MKKYDQFKRQLLNDRKIKKFYDDLESDYELIERLIEKRLERGLTQGELATKIGTKQSAISRLESGNYNPSLAFLNKVASGLGANLKFKLD